MALGQKSLNLASDVWKGMTQGLERGKSFRVHGVDNAKKALNQVEKNAKKTKNLGRTHLKAVGNTTRNVTKATLKDKNGKIKNVELTAFSNNKVYDKAGKMKKINFKKNVQQKPTFGQKTGDFLGGGIRETYKNMTEKEMSLGKAIKQGHTVDGKISAKRIAGTYVTASAVGRVATGGGITKDRNGNTNLIGIPFI